MNDITIFYLQSEVKRAKTLMRFLKIESKYIKKEIYIQISDVILLRNTSVGY